MIAKNIFLSVAIPTPLRCLFDYLPDKNTNHDILKPGLRVSVSFGRQKNVTGLNVSIKNKTVKDIISKDVNILIKASRFMKFESLVDALTLRKD